MKSPSHEAFDMGFAARQRGKPFHANPCVRPSHRQWWEHGWKTADSNIRSAKGLDPHPDAKHMHRKRQLIPRNRNFTLRQAQERDE